MSLQDRIAFASRKYFSFLFFLALLPHSPHRDGLVSKTDSVLLGGSILAVDCGEERMVHLLIA